MHCFLCKSSFIPKINFSQFFQGNSLKCGVCKKALERVQGGCPMCGKKGMDTECEDCIFWKEQGIEVKNVSLFYYNDFAKSIIEQIKYYGDLKALRGFREDIHSIMHQLKGSFISVPVPLHPDKQFKRGFNQAEQIAKLFSYKSYDCLIKNTNITQSKRNKSERLEAKTDFSLKEDSSLTNLFSKNIIIIDDIYTTGSTIHQIAELLIKQGVTRVLSFTLFRS